MIYADAEILRTGNEQLLNNLEEGVIIQEKDTQEIIFMNKSANNFQKEQFSKNPHSGKEESKDDPLWKM